MLDKKPIKIAITGAAGNIGYNLAFRIAAGEMLGTNQPVILQLIEITPALEALKGVKMELQDAAFPLLKDVIVTDDLSVGFKDVECALLVGSRPRGPGMERSELLNVNGMIFGPQGKAINDNANSNVKVLVVGNPANTNALIAAKNAPDLKPEQFTAMTRLDHNRGVGIIAEKTGKSNTDIDGFIIWGNHSSTQYPDINNCTVSGKSAKDIVGDDWYKNIFIEKVQQRGAEIIKARGNSSIASAATAAIGHMRDWVLGTPKNKWVSMAVYSDGSYGVAPGIFFSFPCLCKNGSYEIVQGLELDDFTKEKLTETEKELCEEKESVKELL